MKRYSTLGPGIPLAFRLGLATRGNTNPDPEDILLALDRGVNYWNWCGHDDGMSQAVRALRDRRHAVVVAMQMESASHTRETMWRKLDSALETLQTPWLDIVTLYYVESDNEWKTITARNGSYQALAEAKQQGLLRSIGLTTHQRPLATRWLETGMLDMLMVRYNAAHRGAESEVFPVADRLNIPVVCFTCLRWGALLKPTVLDPKCFELPPAPEWYRFVLSHPSVSVALMAPNDRAELLENLQLIEDWKPVAQLRWEQLAAHGDRVKQSAGHFP